jgi:tyrosine-protein kinase
MPHEHRWRDTSTLQGYVGVVRRRRWIVLAMTVLVTAAAVGFSLLQDARYRASAEVLLSRQNIASSLTGTPDPTAFQDAARFAETQADIARVPAVAERTLRAAGADQVAARAFLDSSEVEAAENSDLLEFRVWADTPEVAVERATEYARQYTLYRRELDTAAIAGAREELEASLRDLRAEGNTETALFESLVEKEQELRTLEALQTSNAFLVRPADEAAQVQPKPLRNGLLGLVLGAILGIIIAFLAEALDTRVRSSEEIGELLGLPLLAQVPGPPRRLRGSDRLVMLAEPSAPEAEAFRMLRTNLDFVTVDRRAKRILVTSAVDREGKSTTAANLAITLARGGRRVVLVDLDLRRPSLDRFFKLEGRTGLAHVALGHAKLSDAIAEVAIAKLDRSSPALGGNGMKETPGMLEVVPAGPPPPDAGEFIATRALGAILDELAEHADVVVVDAPPLLLVHDARALSARVDGIVVVTRMNVVRRRMLADLRRLLDTSPAKPLGYVVTGADAGVSYGYGARYYAAERTAPDKQPA